MYETSLVKKLTLEKYSEEINITISSRSLQTENQYLNYTREFWERFLFLRVLCGEKILMDSNRIWALSTFTSAFVKDSTEVVISSLNNSR